MGGTIRAEEWLEKAVHVEPGGTLFVNADRGSVDVCSHALDEVRVEAEARGWRAGLVTFWLEQDGNDVYVDASIDRFLPRLLGAAHIAIRAWVPRSYSVDAETGGGRVRIEEIDGAVRARTSGGQLEMVGIRGDIEARTSGGRVDARAIDGQLDLRTSGGSVRASFVHEPCGRLESSGGGVDVAFPDTSQVDLDARTSGGPVFLQHPLDEITRRSNRVVGRINGGGLPLLIRTSGGPLHIRALR